jgi:hypothetical protein
MRSVLAVLLASAMLVPAIGAAQSGSTVAQATDDSTAAATVPAEKKKGGLFGKVKGVAKNKVVKTVAKAALCTAVPGGSMIAGALDAAETKNVAGAATTAATGGSSCMPGMAGMAGQPNPAAAGIGAAGAGTLGAVGAGALGAAVSGVGLPGQPSSAMPGMAMSPEQMKQLMEQYRKAGMDPAQIQMMQQMMASQAAAAAAAASGAKPESGESK